MTLEKAAADAFAFGFGDKMAEFVERPTWGRRRIAIMAARRAYFALCRQAKMSQTKRHQIVCNDHKRWLGDIIKQIREAPISVKPDK